MGSNRPVVVPVVVDAVVLAAGRSTRMGRDKALLPAPHDGGLPLWERQWDALRQAGARNIYLSARPEQAWTHAARAKPGFGGVVYDALPGCGPLVGITAALERANGAHLAVLAVDLPRLPVAWVSQLVARCTRGVGAIGRKQGFFEPLAAVYPREMMWLAWEALTRGDYALQRLVAMGVERGLMHVVDIEESQVGWFENWNENPGA